jgi:YesN/AraC family two-component response regulator
MTIDDIKKALTAEGIIDISLLYVEDEAVPRERLAAILRRRVREVHLAGDGQEGLEVFTRIKPDIVVTDIRMPRLSGLDMIREIKQAGPDTRIIVISAFSDVDLLLKSIELEVDGYILKPVEADRLFSVLTRSAEIVRLLNEVRQRDQDQRQLIAELQQSLNEVKTLQGIIPICASCKKVREDTGYWTQVEAYISQHSDLLFSHTVCPDCARKLYPELYDEVFNKNGKK